MRATGNEIDRMWILRESRFGLICLSGSVLIPPERADVPCFKLAGCE